MDNYARGETSTQVDVIIPFHKVDMFLQKAIESVQSSVGVAPRIILVNNSGISVRRDQFEISDEDLLVEEKISGYVPAMAKGVACSSSKYVTFLDSDDFLAPDKILKQLECIRDTKAAIVTGRLIKVSSDGQVSPDRALLGVLPNSINPRVKLVFGAVGADSAILVRGEFIRSSWSSHSDFAPEYADYAWTLKSLSDTTIINSPDSIYFYRMHSEQMSRKVSTIDNWTPVHPLWMANMQELLGESSKILIEALKPIHTLSIAFPASQIKLRKGDRIIIKTFMRDFYGFLLQENSVDCKVLRKFISRRILISQRGMSLCELWGFPSLLWDILLTTLLRNKPRIFKND